MKINAPFYYLSRRFFCAFALLFCLFFSCARANKDAAGTVNTNAAGVDDTSLVAVPPPSLAAILQPGANPLWFQCTPNGPILLETVEDACFSAALIPWPLAPHVRFALARENSLIFAVNGDGFIVFSPLKTQNDDEQTGLYRISGGESWKNYTIGAFILFDDQPTALLYRDDRFFDIDAPLPLPRLWTFNLLSAMPGALSLPALDTFSPQDGWDIDALRRGGDGNWYFRAVKKTAPPEIHMLRSGSLAQPGEAVSLGAFQNAALPEPLSSAPAPLGQLLAAAFAHSGAAAAAVVSPGFSAARYFASNRDAHTLAGFWAPGGALLAIQPDGAAFSIRAAGEAAPAAQPLEGAAQGPTGAATAPTVQTFSLPPLPPDFVYTGIGLVGSALVATWEEQEGYSIGAAGFVVLKPGE